MSAAPPDEVRPRSTLGLVIRATAATLYFAAIFFVAVPVGLLALGAGRTPAGARALLGLAVILVASAVAVRQVARFVVEGRGTHVPLDPPQRFLTAGLYGRIRNPMYLMYVAIIVGEAILFASWLVLGYALVFWLVWHVYVVRVEEPKLRARFGAPYDAYLRAVPRWLPRRRFGVSP